VGTTGTVVHVVDRIMKTSRMSEAIKVLDAKYSDVSSEYEETTRKTETIHSE